MSAKLDKTVHHWTKGPEGEVILTRVIPYVRIVESGEPPIFCQHGMVFYEEGPPIPRREWPSWLPTKLMQLAEKTVQEIGFSKIVQNLNIPEEEEVVEEQPIRAKRPIPQDLRARSSRRQ